jgi:hypothetical protein
MKTALYDRIDTMYKIPCNVKTSEKYDAPQTYPSDIEGKELGIGVQVISIELATVMRCLTQLQETLRHDASVATANTAPQRLLETTTMTLTPH